MNECEVYPGYQTFIGALVIKDCKFIIVYQLTLFSKHWVRYHYAILIVNILYDSYISRVSCKEIRLK